MTNEKGLQQNELELAISPYRDFKSILIYGFGSLFMLLAPYEFIVQFDPSSIIETSLVYSMLFLIGIFCLRRFLWKVNGYEVLIIKDSILTIKRTGIFWTKKRQYRVDKIKNLRINRQLFKSSEQKGFVQNNVNGINESNQRFISMYGKGKISFNYNFDCISFFDNISENEAESIFKQIETRIKTKPNN